MINLGISEEDAKKYTRSSGNKVVAKCPDCGKEKSVVISEVYKSKSIRCSCGDGFSYPQKFTNSMLNQLGVKFIQEYSPNYLIPKEGKKYRKFSDFYLPDYNIVIETDGKLGHRGGIAHSKSDKTLDELIAIDKWKDKQHLKNGIKTIRIDCFKSDREYIRNSMLNSKLSDMFSLDKVNWHECEKFALSNKIKKVCDYWNNKKKYETTTDISRVFGISRNTTVRYLKYGTKIGLCFYDSKAETRKTINKIANKNKKKIEILKNDISLGIFESARQLDLQSKKLFNVHLDYRNISSVANGKLKHYKGFVFRFVDDNNKII